MSDRKWIQEATKNKGGLRRCIPTPKGENIPKGAINQAAKGEGKCAKRARLAQTLSTLRPN